MNLLNSYENGNYNVKIYDDGTKVRTYTDTPNPLYPESIDVLITKSCSLEHVCNFCLVPDTLICMGDGSFRSIDKVNTGDLVLAHDGIEQVVDTVGQLFKREVDEQLIIIKLDDDTVIRITRNHEVKTQNGWKTAGELAIDDELFTNTDQVVTIKSVTTQPYAGTVHNFETVKTHTYFVNNVLVHNCHESATIKGKHGDLDVGLKLLSQLPAGSEVAIGGGNPLAHPGIEAFLMGLRSTGVVANMTMNQLHFKQYGGQMVDFLKRKLIHGLGISYNADNSLDVTKPVLEATTNEVFHLIIGIHTVEDLEKLYAFRKPLKVLLLGYKEFGRGVDYHTGKSTEIEQNITRWYQQLPRFFKQDNIIISFDNLAIKQLNVKRFFTQEGWQKFYMGDDSTFTFYIDLVSQNFGASSTAAVRYPLKETMLETFGSIKQPVKELY